jgi:hypothetical protein
MDINTCYCRNRQCRLYGLTGKKARLKYEDWHRSAPRFRCEVCDKRVSARAGTAYAGLRTYEMTYRYAVTALAEGRLSAPPGGCLDWTKIRYVAGCRVSVSIAKM